MYCVVNNKAPFAFPIVVNHLQMFNMLTVKVV